MTIRQILQMRSGVDYEERYDFGNPGIAANNHEHSLVENVARFADAARTMKRKNPAGHRVAIQDSGYGGAWLASRARQRR